MGKLTVGLCTVLDGPALKKAEMHTSPHPTHQQPFPAQKSRSRISTWPQFPQLRTGLRVHLLGLPGPSNNSGHREDLEVPVGQLAAPGNQSYHELGMAILEGAP